MNPIVGQISIIEFDLLTRACLSMEKPNNECIVVPPTNNVAFMIYVAIQSFCSLFIFIKKSWMALMTCVFPIHVTVLMCCNICLMEFICVNFSNVKS